MELIDLKLDRLTIVGKMKTVNKEIRVGNNKFTNYDSNVLEILKSTRDVAIKESREYASPVYNWRFKIGGHTLVQVRTTQGDGNDFRVEFNPSKVNEEEMKLIKSLLENVKAKIYTRIDLALDIKADLSKGWKITDKKSRKIGEYRSGASGQLETHYRGTNHSNSQIRIYNKAKEQNRSKGALMRGQEEELKEQIRLDTMYSDWWRIEETIRGEKSEWWEDHNWYEGIEIVKETAMPIFPEGTKPNMKANVLTCMQYPEIIDEYSKNTRTAIRKVMKELAYGDGQAFSPSEVLEKEKALTFAEVKGQLKSYIEIGEFLKI